MMRCWYSRVAEIMMMKGMRFVKLRSLLNVYREYDRPEAKRMLAMRNYFVFWVEYICWPFSFSFSFFMLTFMMPVYFGTFVANLR